MYDPDLVKHLLGEQVAELFDGTIEVEQSIGEKIGNLTVGDKLTFKFKNAYGSARQFIVTGKK